jgi:hypothetical protein
MSGLRTELGIKRIFRKKATKPFSQCEVQNVDDPNESESNCTKNECNCTRDYLFARVFNVKMCVEQSDSCFKTDVSIRDINISELHAVTF